MQDALKDIFAPLLEAMLQAELDNHLGYDEYEHGSKSSENALMAIH